MKQQYIFLFTCLAIVAGLMQSFYLFKDHFSPVKEYQLKLSKTERQVERQKLQMALLEAQFVDYRTQVAGLMPGLESLQKNDVQGSALRGLASVSQKSLEPIELSGGLLAQAKSEFKKGNYKSTISDINKLISKYPTSPLVVEAHFFLAESYYLNGQSQECMDVVDRMMSHYPEHELTGYIMLRMGQVLASRNRGEEAQEVFSVIEAKFSKQKDLAVQARRLAQSLE